MIKWYYKFRKVVYLHSLYVMENVDKRFIANFLLNPIVKEF